MATRPKSKRDVTGYDGNGYTVGDRVELHPGMDLWMRGARFGVVTRVRERHGSMLRDGHTGPLFPPAITSVKVDVTGRTISRPADRFRAVGS